ncbi:MAG: epoxyqueuosine reductase [Phycisphaerales bacterium]|nr:MAG: epoxyqueuosine reductase [Phycisphaerales bacterium]
MDRKELDRHIRDSAQIWGVDFVGVADLTPIHDAVVRQWGPVIAEYPRAVSLGIALLNPIVDQLPRQAERAAAMTYRHHVYDVTDRRLDLIASRLSSMLQNEGWSAMPIPASQEVDEEHICGVFSHKVAARLAGIGWIGKNALLITNEVGPRVRLATILTDAPMETSGKLRRDRCGTCTKCIEICPVNAFTGRSFRADEPRDARFDARMCDRHVEKRRKEVGVAVCGLCLYVCPHAKREQQEHKTI